MNVLGLRYINTVNCSSFPDIQNSEKKELPKGLRCQLTNQLLQEIEARKTLAQGLLTAIWHTEHRMSYDPVI